MLQALRFSPDGHHYLPDYGSWMHYYTINTAIMNTVHYCDLSRLFFTLYIRDNDDRRDKALLMHKK